MKDLAKQKEVVIQISKVKKKYKLGQIGGGSLREDIQSWWTKIVGKDDTDIDHEQEQRLVGKNFMALNGIDLTIYKGEAVGIIGSNGAGKSTLLKLLCQVTAPTEGSIDIYGRITSMLEVGTGFNGEMTGRENIYLNGTILGMTKAEIDKKIDDIIEFSEVKDFIDTPVKRYSSGMFIKLGFAVASHLESEIMIMDEVLAVGDMAFQTKCLNKMRQSTKEEGRTVLYVSHNMNTIRQLCDRCIVLDKGKIAFEGEVEAAIKMYLGKTNDFQIVNEFNFERNGYELDNAIRFLRAELIGKEYPVYLIGESIKIQLDFIGASSFSDMAIRMVVQSQGGVGVGLSTSMSCITVQKGENSILVNFKHDGLAPGKYSVKLIAYSINEYGNGPLHDVVEDAFMFEIIDEINGNNHMGWNHSVWGYIKFPQLEIE